MKKIGLVCKEVSANRIKGYLKDSSGCFIVKFSGLSSPQITSLRQSLFNSNAGLFVIKNAVARKALKECGLDDLLLTLDGPSALVFAKDEPAAVSKALYNFAKDNEKLKLEGGVLESKILTHDDVETLAKLPSKEVLRAKVVSGLKSPLFGLALVLNGNLRKLVCCLDQIKKKKEIS